MANGTISLNKQQAMAFFESLASLEKTLLSLRRSLAAQFTETYGDDTWWETSDLTALESIKHGKGKRFNTLQDALSYLHS